ncbi:MAG: membrane protein insertase YidC [Alphaproteobacteria bacterium]
MVQYLNNNNSGFAQWSASKNASKKPSFFSGLFGWLVVFLLSWWLLSLWLSPKADNVNTAPNEEQVVVDLSSVPTSNVSSDKISATAQGLRISNIKLSDFKASVSDDSDFVTLISGDGAFIEVGFTPSGTVAPDVKTVWKTTDGKMSWRNQDRIDFTRKVTADNYVITITDTIKNNSPRGVSFAPYANITRYNDMKSSAGVYNGSVVYANSKIEHEDWARFDKKSYAYSTVSGFAGFVDQYWETVASIDSPDQTISIKKQGDLYSANIKAESVSVAPGESKDITTNIYVGPRDSKILSGASGAIPGITRSIDYGWFWFLSQPMVWALNLMDGFVGNYGIAIILLTILVRILMWPLTRKSYVSTLAMQKMQPELQKIQSLYPNDKQRQQMEMMRLYRENKTSPMSGCLPMLIQIPIFFALYKALLLSVQMRSAHFLWISDLSVMDPYFILPILMGATMWLQQYLQTPPATKNKNDMAAQTQKVMKWMPIMFTVMFAWMPAGLVLYWTVSNVFGIAQMYIIKNQSK